MDGTYINERGRQELSLRIKNSNARENNNKVRKKGQKKLKNDKKYEK